MSLTTCTLDKQGKTSTVHASNRCSVGLGGHQSHQRPRSPGPGPEHRQAVPWCGSVMRAGTTDSPDGIRWVCRRVEALAQAGCAADLPHGRRHHDLVTTRRKTMRLLSALAGQCGVWEQIVEMVRRRGDQRLRHRAALQPDAGLGAGNPVGGSGGSGGAGHAERARVRPCGCARQRSLECGQGDLAAANGGGDQAEVGTNSALDAVGQLRQGLREVDIGVVECFGQGGQVRGQGRAGCESSERGRTRVRAPLSGLQVRQRLSGRVRARTTTRSGATRCRVLMG